MPARSSDQVCLVSGCCSSGRDFAPRFLQTVPRGSALALHSCFTSIRLHRGLSPPGCRTCPAHTTLRAAKGGGPAGARPSLTALSPEAGDIDRSAPGNGAGGLTRKCPSETPLLRRKSSNERPHDVSPKPAKLICSRQRMGRFGICDLHELLVEADRIAVGCAGRRTQLGLGLLAGTRKA